LLFAFAQLFSTSFELNIDLLVSFFQSLEFLFDGNTVILEHIAADFTQFGLVELQSFLELGDEFVLFSHFLAQHFQTLLLLFALNLLSPHVLVNLYQQSLLLSLQNSYLVAKGEEFSR
jgi:hypothetical protein